MLQCCRPVRPACGRTLIREKNIRRNIPSYIIKKYCDRGLRALCPEPVSVRSSRIAGYRQAYNRCRTLFHRGTGIISGCIASNSLVDTRWVINMDIGREKNTWMDPRWAASGKRMEIPLMIEFKKNGIVQPLGVGAYVQMKTTATGTWSMQRDTLSFNVEVSGFQRGDVSIPPGKMFFSVPAWGSVLSRDKGIITINQRRFFVRQEYRIVGRFKPEKVPSELDICAALEQLPSSRVKSGGLDGPVYFDDK